MLINRALKANEIVEQDEDGPNVASMDLSIEAYRQFLERKSQSGEMSGFAPCWMPNFLFDFQRALVDWAIQKGRAAIFADCGLGKTPMQLVWAQNMVEKTNRHVLILCPLGVAGQTMREAEKFGIKASRSLNGHPSICITNYERLHQWNWQDFSACVCDESSILKSFLGSRRRQITDFMRKLPYRLLCTATASPNDYVELGTSSQALGHLDYSEMLSRFFKNEEKLSEAERHGRRTREGVVIAKWLFKGHAEEPFWRWVSSWARMIRKPSDLGFENGGFNLPRLEEREHTIEVTKLPEGKLLHVAAVSFHEQLAERRLNMDERCEFVARLVSDSHRQALVWCHLNQESELLAESITGAAQVSGSDSEEEKEEKFLAFIKGSIRVLVTKPKIGGWGLNFQHCSHETFFPSHSFEQYYQGIRRCWRFGQKHPVTIDIVSTPAEQDVLKNLQRKQRQADHMFENMFANVGRELNIARRDSFQEKEQIPSWLQSSKS